MFENFVKHSGAKLWLGKRGEVVEVVKLDAEEGGRAKWVVKTSRGGGGVFDVGFFPFLSWVVVVVVDAGGFGRR